MAIGQVDQVAGGILHDAGDAVEGVDCRRMSRTVNVEHMDRLANRTVCVSTFGVGGIGGSFYRRRSVRNFCDHKPGAHNGSSFDGSVSDQSGSCWLSDVDHGVPWLGRLLHVEVLGLALLLQEHLGRAAGERQMGDYFRLRVRGIRIAGRRAAEHGEEKCDEQHRTHTTESLTDDFHSNTFRYDNVVFGSFYDAFGYLILKVLTVPPILSHRKTLLNQHYLN
jgi:hypothetical protein